MGQLLKLLLLAGIIAFVVFKLRRLGQNDGEAENPDDKHEKLDKPMTACAVCGTYVPEDEALVKNNKYYCCTEHRDAQDS